jgi:hypothetical protein
MLETVRVESTLDGPLRPPRQLVGLEDDVNAALGSITAYRSCDAGRHAPRMRYGGGDPSLGIRSVAGLRLGERIGR